MLYEVYLYLSATSYMSTFVEANVQSFPLVGAGPVKDVSDHQMNQFLHSKRKTTYHNI